jgi:Mitosis protein DIM1
MAYLLPHLHSGWEVDQAIVNGDDRVVVIRFGRDTDATCMVQDQILASIAEKVKNFAVIYLVCTRTAFSSLGIPVSPPYCGPSSCSRLSFHAARTATPLEWNGFSWVGRY